MWIKIRGWYWGLWFEDWNFGLGIGITYLHFVFGIGIMVCHSQNKLLIVMV